MLVRRRTDDVERSLSLGGVPAQACSARAVAEQRDRLDVFRMIGEDIAFAMSARAKDVFANLTSSAPEATAARSRNWQEFLEVRGRDPAMWRDDRARRLVSAAYSYVATLAYALPDLTSDMPRESRSSVSLGVLGARAEAAMPMHLWRELEWQYPNATFHISLIGDQIAARSGRNEGPSRIHLHECSGLYHDVADKLPHGLPDAFVLFNPGIGHPHIQLSWRPTIETVLASGRPILLSAFSKTDQHRDLAVLRELAPHADFVVQPQPNPFSSLQYKLDPADVHSPILANKYFMIVRAPRG